jgi:hypothetical protein
MQEYTIAYRGICLKEAMEVVEAQKYSAAEERKFGNHIEIKAVFGPGVYLVSDYIVAAEYAYCHAEANKDKGSVVCQTLYMKNPLRLNSCFGEKELRNLALAWKYPDGKIEDIVKQKQIAELSRWTGTIIQQYVLLHGYDGIVYTIHDDFKYYVSYCPDEQIQNIGLDFVYEIADLQTSTFEQLRKQYKSCTNQDYTAL